MKGVDNLFSYMFLHNLDLIIMEIMHTCSEKIPLHQVLDFVTAALLVLLGEIAKYQIYYS